MYRAEQRSPRVVQPAPVLKDAAAAACMPWDDVDALVANEAEARALLADSEGRLPVDRLAEALARRSHTRTVAVTLGAAGCVVYADGRSCRYPALGVVPVDTTGAGDAFVATFAAHLTAGAEVEDAVREGQSAAARVIVRPGAYESIGSD